ncbi:MAG: sigma-70 family RNA polymerase sigma factor [Rhodothermales bacterium]|nr:sigma-70 family RNA polymerase sigma factor [Rhodothermales bacterium]MCA0269040.1 sigma-70 family RNA polymerase sigma factor [Bacteroidota bacterium]
MHALSVDDFRQWSLDLQASDDRGFAALYTATSPALHRYIHSITRDAEATNDVLQELYVKLWNVRTTIDPDRSLKALLFQMARNFALNHERAKRRRASDPLDDHAEPADSALPADALLDTNQVEDRLRAWIDELPPRRREAFCLSRFEGLSHDEIAKAMDLAPKTVNNHIVLALQTLRTRLAEFDPSFRLDA